MEIIKITAFISKAIYPTENWIQTRPERRADNFARENDTYHVLFYLRVWRKSCYGV